jgi:hypothetical protein
MSHLVVNPASLDAASPEPAPLSTWRHLKTWGTYTVLGVSVSPTNGPGERMDRVVVYVSHTYQALRHRDLGEFMDGRFEPVPPPSPNL